jgi:hypothetical protein
VTTLAAAAPRRTFADRLNPILVKEVRQALRGRYFKLMFWLTLAVSTIAGLMVVASGASTENLEELGQPFFLVMFGCMSAAVHAFTPFSAYLSTSAEWDENTHDLLVLSNLHPRQIVLGKLLSALTQALLYYSTFGPFLVFAFLLNGIDLLSISVLLACSLAACVGLSLVGIALASLARVKAARGILMAVFGAALVMVWGASMGAAAEISSSPQDLRDPEGQIAVASFLTFALLVGGLFCAIACARFAHEEENRSTGLRILGTGVLLFASVWSAWLNAQFGQEEIAWGAQIAAACVLFVLWVFFLTEPDPLGRRMSKHVPARPWLALLATPFLPGGGRATLLLLVHFLCALAGALLALEAGTTKSGDAAEVVRMVSVLYAFVFVYLALPAGIASYLVRTGRGRIRARVAIALLLPLAILGPGLLGLLLGIDFLMELEHPLNPAYVLQETERWGDGGGVLAPLFALAVIASVLVVFNAKRVHGGVVEVLSASRARRERLRG